MDILSAYRFAWRRRAIVLPLFLGVTAISVAIITPLLGLAVRVAISLSGQSALTDQDIARFILSPLGIPVFLLMAGLLLVGAVFGLAAMTVDLGTARTGALTAIATALHTIGGRFVALLHYAIELVVRVLLILLPFAGAALLIAAWLLGDHDINYYLGTRPPEFIAAVVAGGGLVAIAAALLVRSLLGWAVSLHLVLFGRCEPHPSFSTSTKFMAGRKARLLRDLAGWFVVRLVLSAVIAAIFALAIKFLPGAVGGSFRSSVATVLLLSAIWVLADLIVSAISLGALAKLLFDVHEEAAGALDSPEPGPARPTSAIVFLLGAASVLALGLFTGSQALDRVQADHSVLVIAHRGASGSQPENTLAAIRAAVEEGADWVEIDVQETSDGQVVVMHDSDFMKVAGRDNKIWDTPVADLASIDIGSWFDPAFAEERVPTLAEALEVTRDRARLLIELKYYGHDDDLEARAVAVVEAAGLQDQVATMSLKYPAVQKMKALRPDWPTGVLAATAVGDLTSLDGDFIAVNAGMARPGLFRRAQENGKRMLVWTVNDPLEMSALISLGVDGLITDEPALARAVIEARGELSAQERFLLLLLDRLGLTGAIGATGDGSP